MKRTFTDVINVIEDDVVDIVIGDVATATAAAAADDVAVDDDTIAADDVVVDDDDTIADGALHHSLYTGNLTFYVACLYLIPLKQSNC